MQNDNEYENEFSGDGLNFFRGLRNVAVLYMVIGLIIYFWRK